MAKQETEIKLKEFFDWFQARYSVKELKKADEIITPYTNHLNDRIRIYVEYLDSGKIRLSDDGITIDELGMAGIDINAPTRQKILKDILRNFGLSIANDVIFTIANPASQFPQKKINLLQGILQIYDILFTSKETSYGIFQEEVQDFLFENDFGGTPNPKLVGASGIQHSIDYSIGPTKSRPHTLIKLLNNPTFNDVVAQQYVSSDLEKGLITPKSSVRFVIIGNDKKNKLPKKAAIAAEDIGIGLIPWSNKSEILLLK